MKIRILTKDLKIALENLIVVIDKKSNLPILKMIGLRTNHLGGFPKIELLATNSDQTLKTSLSCDILEAGEGCIDTVGLLAICKKTKERILEIEILEEVAVATVKAGEFVLKLQADYFSDFPILKGDLPESGEVYGLIGALDFVEQAISNDPTRYYLNGANLKSLGDSLEIVAIDGHILLKTILKTDLKLNCIIPHNTVKTILKVWGKIHGIKLIISWDKLKINICSDQLNHQYDLFSKLIDGEFPEYEKIIPKGENALEYEIDGKKLSEAIKQIEPERKFKPYIEFKFGEKLELESKAGKTSIDCIGREFLIGFNVINILKICKTFGNFKMSFKNAHQSSPAFVENSLGIGVFMPCKI
jgi:DNA polymerase-3 subunit beta